MTERARILVLNQYYWPGIEATAQPSSQLCEALATDYEVTVVTGQLHGHELPDAEVRNGVKIVRVRSTTHDRSQLHLRAANYGSYLGRRCSTCAGCAASGQTRARMTDPPVVGDIGSWSRGASACRPRHQPGRLPEIAERVKRLQHLLVVGALRKLVAPPPSAGPTASSRSARR